MNAFAVIGAGYGDEGKGLMVDALVARQEGRCMVVRANGGAQAGHTVVAPDGTRHVFHHLGAGALAGAPVHLSRFFVSHPMLFTAERDAVVCKGGEGGVSADPRGPVTTPWDMLINQIAEQARGAGRHGSCGLGFGETLERSLHADFALTVADMSAPHLADRLRAIRDLWAPRRLAALGVGAIGADQAARLADDVLLERFLEDCAVFAELVTPADDRALGSDGRALVFEGAQGLGLDKDHGVFPHVTRSSTGLRNMLAIAAEAGLDAIEATYVTRAYATRHGAGPLAHETGRLDAFDVVDATNRTNPWQGSLRLAPLDTGVLAAAVGRDLALAQGGAIRVRAGLAVTCLDQARGAIPFVDAGEGQACAVGDFGALLAGRLGLGLAALSWGPSRTAVEFTG